MKFILTDERRMELQREISELERWVRELEELDLGDCDLILAPSPPTDQP